MNKTYYPNFKILIDEIEHNKALLSSNNIVGSYYPHIFLLSVVSTFEKEIKKKFENILSNPIANLNLPGFFRLVSLNPTYSLENLYKKFQARDDNGVIKLNAQGFYALFGGQPFQTLVSTTFQSIKQIQIKDFKSKIDQLKPLLGTDDQTDRIYLYNDEICKRLLNLTFHNAETAFLQLKLKRNKVAHNFLTGISDSFEDIRDLYYDAVLYVVSIKEELSKFSVI